MVNGLLPIRKQTFHLNLMIIKILWHYETGTKIKKEKKYQNIHAQRTWYKTYIMPHCQFYMLWLQEMYLFVHWWAQFTCCLLAIYLFIYSKHFGSSNTDAALHTKTVVFSNAWIRLQLTYLQCNTSLHSKGDGRMYLWSCGSSKHTDTHT